MEKLKFTLKAWPLITLITVMLCISTQCAAKLFGIDLPEQTNILLVRNCAGMNWVFASLVFQIVILLPAVEEVIFRYLLWKAPLRLFRGDKSRDAIAVAAIFSAVIFSFAHYIDYLSWAHSGNITLKGIDNAFLALGFFGLAQCWLYRKTHALSAAILNHSLFNATNLTLLFIVPTGV